MFYRITFLSCMLTLSGALAAQPGYNYVEAKVANLETANLDLFGFGIAGSYAFSDRAFGRASLVNLNDEVANEDIDYSRMALGGGYIFYQQLNTNAYLGAELINTDLDVGPGNAEGDGYGLFTGLRTDVSERLELNAELNVAEIDDADQTTVKGGLVYSLQNNFEILGELGSIEGDMTWGVGMRYEF